MDTNNKTMDDQNSTTNNLMTASCPYSNLKENDFRKFHILDETEEDDEQDEDAYYDDDEDDDEDEDEESIGDDEIEKMLDDAYQKRKRKKLDGTDNQTSNTITTTSRPTYEEREKIVLIEKTHNHFDVLPEGWIQVTHNSGMPLFLHKQSRVCTMAKPYFLGPGSVRKHEIPLNAIPCLSYRKALQRELDEQQQQQQQQQQRVNELDNLPNARIETVKENNAIYNLKPDDIYKYASNLFKFRTIKVMRFKSWSERRKFTKKRKQEKQLQRPNLPDGTKLITFPIHTTDGVSNGGNGNSNGVTSGCDTSMPNMRREWIMNPNGKSYVCILHEYVQHALKKQPTYKFTELENAATPYAATVSINDMQYGVGYGTSKKQAKSEAAKATLEILIPEMKEKITADAKTGASASKDQDQDLSFFDEIRIEDPRVAEFCAKTTEPSPHDILLTCLQRNFGLNELQINYQGNTLKNKKNQYTMTVGKHTATVVCKNKRDGKQRASQAILQALHPHINSWGSLLRLYGNRSVKSFKEKKLEEQEITLLQSKAAVNSPNFAILDKLKLELGKLASKRKEIKPIGVLMSNEGGDLPKLSSSNLKNVDL